MPNLVKIGKTTKSAVERAKELSSVTGVATRFMSLMSCLFPTATWRSVFYMSVSLPAASAPIAEFFAIDVREAIKRLRQVGAEFPPTGWVDDEQSPIRD